MIRFTAFRTNLPNGNPWFAIGPVYTGRAEWRRTCGVSVSFGNRSYAVHFEPRKVEATR